MLVRSKVCKKSVPNGFKWFPIHEYSLLEDRDEEKSKNQLEL